MHPRQKNFVFLGIALVLLTAAVLGPIIIRKISGRKSAGLVKGDSGTRLLMGTIGRIQLWCESEAVSAEALEAAFAELDQVDRLMSTYREDSELSRVNREAGERPVKVSAETYNLLVKALDYSRMTEGAFDITVGPLVRLWKQAAAEDRRPGETELSAVREKVGYRKLILSAQQQTVFFAEEGMELNVDAIAKGYAVDRALGAVRRRGVAAALVDVGGEIACFGGDYPEANWIVGIQDLFTEDNANPFNQRPGWRVALRDCSIATSGNYRQYVTIGGQRYSHIIDPRTGRPAEKLPSVTIIASRTEDGDALATAISVLGAEKGLALIESLADTEAFLVAGTVEKPIIHRSSGFEKFEIK